MADKHWLESIYSDGTARFVSAPSPGLGQTVTITLRLYEDAPAEHVLLRSVHNGEAEYEEMRLSRRAQGFAYYTAPLRMTEPRVRYRFALTGPDGIFWYNQRGWWDGSPEGVYDFALLTDYRQPAWVKEAVFYQIFPDRFCNADTKSDVRDGALTQDGHPSIAMKWTDAPLPYEQGFCMDYFGGDLDGIREKIPYLKDLGVTAVYLNPIFTAPSVHKYNCIDYLHVDPCFGGDEALARLSAALHENGMRLILDISINHTGTDHRWFNRDGRYFDASLGAFHNPDAPERSYYFFDETGAYLGWHDLDSMPVLNYTSQALRGALYRRGDSVLKKWLKPPYSIDGWRFDVADTMAKNDAVQLYREVWPEIRRSIREENPEAYILAEDWGDCADCLQGDEWDAPMNYYGCARILREFYGGPDLYLERNPVLRSASRGASAEQVRRRVEQFLGKLPWVLAENLFNLLDSHDAPRIAHMGYMTPGKLRGAAILMFMLPGAPSIYYGDEAEIGGWTHSVEGCRFPMPWDRDIPATQSYRLYHRLCELKRTHGALSHGGMKFLYAQGQALSLARFDGDEIIVAVASAGGAAVEIDLELALAGAAEPVGDTDCFGAPLRWRRLDARTVRLSVEPEMAYMFLCKPIKEE